MTHPDPASTTVLVTGASGFIAAHCIIQLLQQGYRVRGTLRNPALGSNLRAAILKQVGDDSKLEFVRADLSGDEGWNEAAEGCRYVLHVASPYPSAPPKHEDDLIIPAREGTLRVLRAGAGAGRVVVTSSMAAILYGHDDYERSYDEDDWTNLGGKITAYVKSKTIAERAAWAFMDDPSRNNGAELAVINPGYVMGPSVDGRSYSTSGDIVGRMMRREYPGCSRLYFPMADVRDVAAAHLAAMTVDAAAGRRYICVAGGIWMLEMAQLLQKQYGDRGYRINARSIPDFAVRMLARIDKNIALVVNDLGHEYRVSNARSKNELGWQPRSPEEAIIATADSLIEHGLV